MFMQTFFLAVAGTDYFSVQFYRILPSGSADNALECFDITIINDAVLEGNEAFTVTLSTPDQNVMLRTNTSTITITDNDSKCGRHR